MIGGRSPTEWPSDSTNSIESTLNRVREKVERRLRLLSQRNLKVKRLSKKEVVVFAHKALEFCRRMFSPSSSNSFALRDRDRVIKIGSDLVFARNATIVSPGDEFCSSPKKG